MAPGFIIAQQKDSTRSGIITGKVKDSTYNFMLTSATVAVYRDADSSILQYTLPNNFGEFSVPSLPVNIPLRLIITHVGYRDFYREFTLSPCAASVDFGLLYLWQMARDSSGELMEEVVVKAVPPMRMNGDTLEFNFDAFRAEPNTTVEDQIRRLPGMVIWGDGEITFNGKPIHALLVDGKPFMGTGDITVATQNLPKDAVEKLQVYQQRDEKNPLDSTLFANLKLKDDKKMGYFGKASAGYGYSPAPSSENKTATRYAVDGMLSGFNKKLQIATVAGANNVNKVSNGVDALMRNASYKGEGTNLEYQTDFNMRGVNKPIMGGARFQYDFIPDVQYQKSRRLNADYFINHNNTQTINTNLEKRFINADTVLLRQSNSSSVNRSDDQRASARYEFSTERFSLNLNAAASANEDENKNISNSVQEKTGMGVVNRNSTEYDNYNSAKNLQAGISFTNRERYDYSGRNKRRLPTEFTISYSLILAKTKGIPVVKPYMSLPTSRNATEMYRASMTGRMGTIRGIKWN